MKSELDGRDPLQDKIALYISVGDPGAPRAIGRSGRGMNDEIGQPVRVLVVDDDPVMKEMVVNYLEQHNMRATAASGGREMAERLAENEPDLVILDLRLDQEDGLGSVEIQDSHYGLDVIQAWDGTICTDGRPMGEDGTALSGQADGPRTQRQRQPTLHRSDPMDRANGKPLA